MTFAMSVQNLMPSYLLKTQNWRTLCLFYVNIDSNCNWLQLPNYINKMLETHRYGEIYTNCYLMQREKNSLFSSSIAKHYIKNNECTRVANYYALTRGLFWCLFTELRSNEGNKHQTTREINTKITSSERINRSSREYIHCFIFYTVYLIHKWQ